MTEINPEQKPSFVETIEPLAMKHNLLKEQAYQWIGNKREEVQKEQAEIYAQMVDKTAEAILQVTREERKSILDTAISSFQRSSRINVTERQQLGFVKDIFLKTIEIRESRSPQNPQK